jgi:hypothetical protein
MEDGDALNNSLIQQQPLLAGGAGEVMDDDYDDEE